MNIYKSPATTRCFRQWKNTNANNESFWINFTKQTTNDLLYRFHECTEPMLLAVYLCRRVGRRGEGLRWQVRALHIQLFMTVQLYIYSFGPSSVCVSKSVCFFGTANYNEFDTAIMRRTKAYIVHLQDLQSQSLVEFRRVRCLLLCQNADASQRQRNREVCFEMFVFIFSVRIFIHDTQ